jgi:hypothetical protein
MNKSTYYLEVLVDNLSICLDSDINYYHHFKVGEIIRAEFGMNDLQLIVDGCKIHETLITIDWDKTKSKKVNLATAIKGGLLSDITINILREKKLNKLGI